MCIEITAGITIAQQQCLQVSLRLSYLLFKDQNLNSHLFPLFISYKSSRERLITYQANSSCVIRSVILMTTLFDKALILQGEIWCWSPVLLLFPQVFLSTHKNHLDTEWSMTESFFLLLCRGRCPMNKGKQKGKIIKIIFSLIRKTISELVNRQILTMLQSNFTLSTGQVKENRSSLSDFSSLQTLINTQTLN